jgi:hypothetical protein
MYTYIVYRLVSSGCSCRPSTKTLIGTVNANDAGTAQSIATQTFGGTVTVEKAA